jgi:hypothetical protein
LNSPARKQLLAMNWKSSGRKGVRVRWAEVRFYSFRDLETIRAILLEIRGQIPERLFGQEVQK